MKFKFLEDIANKFEPTKDKFNCILHYQLRKLLMQITDWLFLILLINLTDKLWIMF